MNFKSRFCLLLFLVLLILPTVKLRADAASSGRDGWQQDDSGSWHYYTGGKPASGWKTINSKTYYFDPAKGNAMATGFTKIAADGKTYTYYFMDKDSVSYTDAGLGQMMTGFKTIKRDGVNRAFYFADYRYKTLPRGSMLTGFKTIAGSKYYFADYRYKAMPYGSRLSGWKTISGKKYYFADYRCPDWKVKGSFVTGFVLVSDKAYFFSSAGVLDETWASKHVIVIDPGHSSEIPDGDVPIGPGSKEMKEADNYGTQGISTGVHEYELNLTVSLKLRDALKQKGYKVVMVRTTNKGKYSCVARAEIANKNNAAVFLRVHANAAPKDHSKTGAMALCITKNNPFIPKMYKSSRLLSDLILKNYVKATGCFNEGVEKRDTLISNNWSKVPTTLIELGYMTNAKEDKLMQTKAYQTKMVTGLVNGIDAYFKETAK